MKSDARRRRCQRRLTLDVRVSRNGERERKYLVGLLRRNKATPLQPPVRRNCRVRTCTSCSISTGSTRHDITDRRRAGDSIAVIVRAIRPVSVSMVDDAETGPANWRSRQDSVAEALEFERHFPEYYGRN
jgi:hypothetical protein